MFKLQVNTSEEEGSGSGTSSNGSIAGQEDRSTPLIERVSPVESQGSSSTFGSYNDRSPILMSPEKLGKYVISTNDTAQDRFVPADPRGRRSASLPGPPLIVTRDDRSMSLPHSPGLQPRENRAASVTSRLENPNLERITPVRPKRDSFGPEAPRLLLQEPSRKNSSTSTNASASGSTTTSTTAQNANGSKRNEVYV